MIELKIYIQWLYLVLCPNCCQHVFGGLIPSGVLNSEEVTSDTHRVFDEMAHRETFRTAPENVASDAAKVNMKGRWSKLATAFIKVVRHQKKKDECLADYCRPFVHQRHQWIGRGYTNSQGRYYLQGNREGIGSEAETAKREEILLELDQDKGILLITYDIGYFSRSFSGML
ncbi:uncharacterized protein LOC132614882 isoform X2 [Lycium barbarum]|uniref:uncharacterized protein LOC132614882 isoform X2 n=1 Tax=Lycium barbarum TaxID=112863 RepID=UPI00293F5B62|nr:uncharacterized protein LOC132614882 isoform X2 [Lycium barbarum]